MQNLIGTRVIGNYRITAELGEGGMGAVYVAEHDTMDEKLAVKVLLPQWSSNQQIVQRFLAEARAASAIKHPNIIRMVDAGILDTGEHFIAMEFLAGYPLDQVDFPLPIETALKILVQVCAGLEAAHALGIIHRDLKPPNLYVTPKPHNALLVKILDFGIAKLNDEHLAGGVKTLTHQAMGTPYYMSPEQARATRDVDHRTDIYALGAIAFELVTGERPYSPTSIGDLVLQQHSGPPPDPRNQRPDVPVAWADVIVSSLGADPAMRPQSARMFAERLIGATPNGVALAASVGYEAHGVTAPPPALGLGPTLTADNYGPKATTLSSGVGQAVSPALTQPRGGGRTKVVVSVVAALAVAAAVFFTISMVRGGSSNDDTAQDMPIASETAPSDAQQAPPSSVVARTTPDAAPVSVTVKSEPASALLSIDGDKKGKGPRTVTRRPGETINVEGWLRGYDDASEDFVVAATDETVVMKLEKKSRHPKPPKEKPPKPVTDPVTPAPEPHKDKPKTPKPFNPDDVVE